MSEHRYEHYGRGFSVSDNWGLLCSVAGVCTVLFGALTLVRNLAPGVVPWLAAIDSMVYYVVTGILAVATVVLVVAARLHDGPRQRYKTATRWGLVACTLAVVLVGLGASIGHLFPSGLIQAPVRDEAPISDTAAMEAGIDATSEDGCVDGWQDISATGYPGVTTIRMCPSSLVAYAIFDNDSYLEVYEDSLQELASSTLDEYTDADDTQWATLSTGQWIVVGESNRLQTLQEQWGGTLEAINGGDETSESESE